MILNILKIWLFSCFLFPPNCFAQEGIDASLGDGLSLGGGKTICTFIGKMPIKKFMIENTSIQLDLPNMNAQILSNLFVDDKEQSTSLDFTGILTSTKLFTTVQSLVGKPIKLSGSDFVFSFLLLNRTDKSSVEITDETEDAQISQYKGQAFINKIVNNKAEGNINLTFSNSVKIVILSDGNIDRMNNGTVKLKCKFVDIPVSIK